MDMRLDQTATGEASARVIDLARPRQAALDGDDLAAGDSDIQRLFPPPIGEAGVTNDQIHA